MQNFTFILFFCAIVATAQDAKKFSRSQEFYIHGNTRVIANNSLSKKSKKALDDTSLVNDMFDMTYVDIDNDKSTFCSSAANLTIPKNSTIKHVALYWTGTYPGAISVKTKNDEEEYFEVIKDRSNAIDVIKFKTPNSNYTTVSGAVIFDGFKSSDTTLKERSPYVCYADVTEIIKSQTHTSGTYTVANIAAVEGKISGGSSAGWLMYVVFENENEPLQYFTSYHGFEYIKDKPVDVIFDNFEAPDSGEINSKITIGALEGDSLLKKDRASIYNAQTDQFVLLKNKHRKSLNFFNSTITNGNAIFLDRTPNSKNTLGFDVATLDIPNNNNSIIANNCEQVKLRFATKLDRYFLFFTAFQTSLSKTYLEEKTNPNILSTPQETQITNNSNNTLPAANTPPTPKEVAITNNAPVLKKPNTAVTTTPIAAKESAPTLEPIKTKEVAVKSTSTTQKVVATPKPATKISKEKNDTLKPKSINSATQSETAIPNGYYIITNVFSDKKNIDKWYKILKKEGFEPRHFVHPIKKWNYIYIAYSKNDEKSLKEACKFLKMRKIFADSWVFKADF